MADIRKGHAFSSGDLVTAGKLNNLVDDASIVDITEAAFAAGSHIITSSSEAPSLATAGHVWWDTSLTEADARGILKVHDGTRWQSVAKNVEQYYKNLSGGTLTYGDVVVFHTSGAIADVQAVTTTTSDPSSTLVAGVIASAADGSSTVDDNEDGRVVRFGLVVVNTTGSVDRGDYLGTSGTVKLAKSLGSSQVVGAFGVAVKNTATDKWLVALSGHTVDYIQKTTTEVLLQQNSTDGTVDNSASTSGGSMGDPAQGTTVATGLRNLYWFDSSEAIADDQNVEVAGLVTVVANQLIHVEIKDICLAMTSSHSNTGRACGAGLMVKITDNATGDVKSLKHWPGYKTHTKHLASGLNFKDSALDSSEMLQGMSDYILTQGLNFGTEGSPSIVTKHAIWWKSLSHSFTPDVAGTYKVKVYWWSNHSGANWNILNPNHGSMASLGMGKPTLKVVTR